LVLSLASAYALRPILGSRPLPLSLTAFTGSLVSTLAFSIYLVTPKGFIKL
jgi:hypothetical protein